MRFIVWLLALVLPVSATGWYAIEVIEGQLADRVVTDLEAVRGLEAARLEQALANYESDAASLAAGVHVRDFTSRTVATRAGIDVGTIGGVNQFAEIDPLAASPLQELTSALQQKAASTGSEIAELRIVATSFETLGQTSGYEWAPADRGLIEEVVASGQPAFGDAFRRLDGSDRLGLVTPIFAPGASNDVIVGALVVEMHLAPLVELVSAHNGFGDTSEAHIAQPTIDGDAEFITPLRFRTDAAFDVVVPAEKNVPINQSLLSPNGKVVWSPDYRATDSILAIETIEATGWGLVVKIDEAEALAPVKKLKRTLSLAGGAAFALIILGWATLVCPMVRRLGKTASAAERVAAGDYGARIDDQSSDEIGSMASSIDRLAADLAFDIAARTTAEAKLRHQACYDSLTLLPNRQHGRELMDAMVSDADLSQEISLFFLDLDGFKAINDTYGHGVGDQVLRAVAARLDKASPAEAMVARWGGDEFVIVGCDLPANLTDTIHAAFDEPIATSSGQHYIWPSIGRSIYVGGMSVDDLLHHADDAMFEQKNERSGQKQIAPDTIRLVEEALENDRVHAWFQPVVKATEAGTHVVGCEALVRIINPYGRVVAPSEFLPAVQGSHLGRAVDRRVITQAIDTTADWIAKGFVPADFMTAFNCGDGLMGDAHAPMFLADCLGDAGLDGSNLVMEISETSATLNHDLIQQMKDLGITIAIDDVGIKHSNADRLHGAGASMAKIDRHWLPMDETSDPQRLATLRQLVGMCDALGMDVVIEGIESEAQLSVSLALGVHSFQGFLFGHAVSSEDFAEQFTTIAASAPSAPVLVSAH